MWVKVEIGFTPALAVVAARSAPRGQLGAEHPHPKRGHPPELNEQKSSLLSLIEFGVAAPNIKAKRSRLACLVADADSQTELNLWDQGVRLVIDGGRAELKPSIYSNFRKHPMSRAHTANPVNPLCP